MYYRGDERGGWWSVRLGRRAAASAGPYSVCVGVGVSAIPNEKVPTPRLLPGGNLRATHSTLARKAVMVNCAGAGVVSGDVWVGETETETGR